MAKVLRLHKGAADTIGNWDTSVKIGTKAIDSIADPIGANDKHEITSIPSPFARMDLIKRAFKIVAESSLEGKTAYHTAAAVLVVLALVSAMDVTTDTLFHKEELEIRLKNEEKYKEEYQKLKSKCGENKKELRDLRVSEIYEKSFINSIRTVYCSYFYCLY